MVEIVVMLAILVSISGIVLTGFPGFNEGAALVRGAQELALSLRKAQNIAFAVAEVALADGTRVIPQRIGLHFDIAAPGEYFLFVDQNDDNIYTPGIDAALQGTEKLPRNIVLVEIKDEQGRVQTNANVVFLAPEAETSITNDAGPIGASLTLKLTAPGQNLSRSITVRTSGQIAIQ